MIFFPIDNHSYECPMPVTANLDKVSLCSKRFFNISMKEILNDICSLSKLILCDESDRKWREDY